MQRRLTLLTALLLAPPAALPATAAPPTPAKPNVIYIMSDELGYYEPGFMGGRNIQTPNLDRMAAEGIRFNNLFAGSCVCAPTRCCFLTGKHSGHTSVRVNGGGTPLRAEEVTIASMLKPLGYAAGGFGKWGCGGRDSTGVPEKHGFDVFLGYYDQVHAHSYYPPYLIRNSEELPLAGNHGGSSGQTYSQYMIHDAALKFIREHAQQPFFAYLPYTPPHGMFSIPDSDPAWAIYKDKPWSEEARRYAAMVTMEDRQVGEVLALLKELGLDQNTLVFFSGDNGGADYFTSAEHPRGVHSANKNPQTGVEYRGKKGTLYEGGLRVPFIARWPGKIAPGTSSDHLGYFPDVLPTIAEVTGAKAPADVDGISLLPTLIGEAAAGRPQREHEYLFWEIGNATAIRQGTWRAVRRGTKAKWELYDLAADPSESKDLADAKPDVVAHLSALATQAHEPAVEGTFARTDRHERDRRAKTGQHDQSAAPEPKRKAKPAAKTFTMPVQGLLSNKEWKIVLVSSENTANQKYARQAIDGDPATLWHTKFSGGIAPPPHELVIDLGAEHLVRGFVYLGRQDAGWNGAVNDIEFCLSQSPDKFGDPLVKTQLAKTKEPQTVACPATQGRYVLLRALSEHSGHQFASVAELGVMGE
ncbi:MAG: sulfatase-like hydrolase/transferase [Planctomycetota bacterium]|nr:sulfatase-like hydrolase/transferase [Planctomycetota bacterium]